MKKIIPAIILLIMLPFAAAIAYYPGTQTGTTQYYTASFDGEGEAAVAAKITVQNTGTTELSKIDLEIPGQNIRMVNIVQEYFEMQKYCQEYDYEYCEKWGQYSCIQYKCKKWGEQKSWPPKYKTITFKENTLSKSVTYTFDLPEKVKPQETATVILYYKTKSYAEKNLGAFKFDFETIKLNYDTQNVQAAIQVSPGLHLKGGKSEVEYRDNIAGMEKAMAAPSSAGISSDALTSFSNSIGTGSYYKTAQHLDPLESFHVKGSYAKTWIGLHWIGTTLALLGLGAAGFLFWLMVIRRLKKMKTKSLALKIIGISFGANAIMAVIWLFTWLMITYAFNSLPWNTKSLLSLVLVMFSGFITLALLFGPAVFMGVKNGLMAGVWTFVATFTIAFLLSIIAIIAYAFIQPGYPPIYYNMARTMAETVAVDATAAPA